MNLDITPRSLDLFLAYARDAANWGGSPLVGGNVGGTQEDRGNLTQLKQVGLIETWVDREPGMPPCTWIEFTPAGREFAQEYGIDIF